nr:unnamed protein product [Callosobruchus chinensis]
MPGMCHPVVVETLKKPKYAVELQPTPMREFEQITNEKLDNDTTENKYKYVYYDEKMQVIYICRYTRSMANLGESLRELEEICLENDIPELFIVKSETNIDFLNDLKVIRDILRRNSAIKVNVNTKDSIKRDAEAEEIGRLVHIDPFADLAKLLLERANCEPTLLASSGCQTEGLWNRKKGVAEIAAELTDGIVKQRSNFDASVKLARKKWPAGNYQMEQEVEGNLV